MQNDAIVSLINRKPSCSCIRNPSTYALQRSPMPETNRTPARSAPLAVIVFRRNDCHSETERRDWSARPTLIGLRDEFLS